MFQQTYRYGYQRDEFTAKNIQIFFSGNFLANHMG